MNLLPGITPKDDLAGVCDLCNAPIPPSGGIISSKAMKRLVETAFDIRPILESPFNPWMQRAKTEGRFELYYNHMKQVYLREELGDFAVCPACWRRAFDHFESPIW